MGVDRAKNIPAFSQNQFAEISLFLHVVCFPLMLVLSVKATLSPRSVSTHTHTHFRQTTDYCIAHALRVNNHIEVIVDEVTMGKLKMNYWIGYISEAI